MPAYTPSNDDAAIMAREAGVLGAGPRIAPIAPEKRTPEQQQLIERAQPPAQVRQLTGGGDTEWVEIMAHHVGLFGAHLMFAQKFMTEAALTPRDRELAVLRLAWLSGAPFEWGGHVTIGKACGLSVEEIARIKDGPDVAGWTAHESAVLRATEELHADAMISDGTWAALCAGFDEAQLIEFVLLVGHYTTVAYYQNALRFRLPEGNEGLRAL